MKLRPRPFPSLLLCCLALAAAGPLAAESFELPAEMDLTWQAIALELDRASVTLVIDPSATPRLRARVRPEADGEPAPSTIRPPVLDLTSRGGGATLRRRAGTAPTPVIVVEVVLDRRSSLELRGDGLEVVVEERPATEADADDEALSSIGEGRGGAAVPGAAGLSFAVENSSLQLSAVRDPTVTATDSAVDLDGTSGKLTLTLEGGGGEVRGHRGNAVLKGRRSEIWVGDLAGGVNFALEGGSLTFRDGQGQLNGFANGGAVRVDGWQGPSNLSGTGASFEARWADAVSAQLILRGSDLDALVENLQGLLDVTLRGGRITVRDKRGITKIQAQDGADVELEAVPDSSTLALESGSSARLTDVGGLEVRMVGGRLELDGASRLELEAEAAEISGGGVAHLARAQLTDSRLDLDLTASVQDPRLTLRGETEAWVRLPTPCVVRVGDPQLLSAEVDVVGCVLQGDSSRPSRFDPRRGIEGNRRLTLHAEMTERCSLEVEGYP